MFDLDMLVKGSAAQSWHVFLSPTCTNHSSQQPKASPLIFTSAKQQFSDHNTLLMHGLVHFLHCKAAVVRTEHCIKSICSNLLSGFTKPGWTFSSRPFYFSFNPSTPRTPCPFLDPSQVFWEKSFSLQTCCHDLTLYTRPLYQPDLEVIRLLYQQQRKIPIISF